MSDGEGRLNISVIDFLPGRQRTWPLAKAPWSDGYSFVSPVDHFGEKGRNGFGIADMCGGVWEVILDDFDPKGGQEELHVVTVNPRPVCRGGNYFDVPGNARCDWDCKAPAIPTRAMVFAFAWASRDDEGPTQFLWC